MLIFSAIVSNYKIVYSVMLFTCLAKVSYRRDALEVQNFVHEVIAGGTVLAWGIVQFETKGQAALPAAAAAAADCHFGR